MNDNIRAQLRIRKRRIERRLDKSRLPARCPVLGGSNIEYELSDRVHGVSCGGIGLIHEMVGKLGLAKMINENVNLFKIYLPYSESDHVLNIAYNILAGGTCLEHLEYLRNDECYLDALGAERIPDPTTAGDFCRRFDPISIFTLMQTVNEVRLNVWREQPQSFFDEAVIEADGSMVSTTGECKRGMNINYKGEWGYHPLLVSLANTNEPLFIVNRQGNRPSHEHAAVYFNQAIGLCRRGGFRKIRLRGDTDFSQTEHLDGWDDDGVKFVFGIDAMKSLYELAENLPISAWTPLERRARYAVRTQPRSRPDNVKQQIVEEREYTNIRLVKEHVAEFSYQPTQCVRAYRIVAVWKDLEVTKGQRKLFDDSRCFFYITNDWESSASEIVFQANQRCNQENVIEQHKNGVHALTAPLDTLESNWAYMVIASLAWSLKAWAALLTPVHPRWKEKHESEKRTLLRMDFSTFRRVMIHIPAQIVKTGRRIVYRLLAWNSWQEVFLRLHGQLRLPQRC